jgi:LytS/YehU family sensor histidine kinase
MGTQKTKSALQFSNYKQTFRAVTAFWIAIVGGMLLTAVSFLAHVGKDWTLDSNYHLAFSFTINFLLLFVILVVNFRIIKSTLTHGWKYALAIILSLIIAGVFSVVAGWLHEELYDNLRFSDPDSLNLTRDFVVAVFAVLISITLFSLMHRQQIRIEKEKLQTENLMVRYEALENQLDPHFLFNSLNTLSGLIGSDDDKAQQYLQQLASTYRYIMQGKRMVMLDDELTFVDSYCQMMQIRYGNNLQVERHIDNRYLHYQIIPISIQLLIENAIKHNIVSARHPLTISLETTNKGTFRVSNPMQPKQEDTGNNGLGLANLAKRYQLLCRQEVVISNSGNTFSVEVPLIEPLQAAKIMSSQPNGNDKN